MQDGEHGATDAAEESARLTHTPSGHKVKTQRAPSPAPSNEEGKDDDDDDDQ